MEFYNITLIIVQHPLPLASYQDFGQVIMNCFLAFIAVEVHGVSSCIVGQELRLQLSSEV